MINKSNLMIKRLRKSKKMLLEVQLQVELEAQELELVEQLLEQDQVPLPELQVLFQGKILHLQTKRMIKLELVQIRLVVLEVQDLRPEEILSDQMIKQMCLQLVQKHQAHHQKEETQHHEECNLNLDVRIL